MNEHIRLLGKSPLLKPFSAESLNSYLKDGSFRVSVYGKNNVIHFSGDVCLKLEIILSGHVSVERIDEAGGLMTIAEFYAGETLGGNLIFSRNPYFPMTITAKRQTEILQIDKERLLTLFTENSVFLRSYLEFVADHAAILGDRIKHYVNKTIRECVMFYLEYERQKQNSNRIRLPITKKALSEKIGVSRTSLSRELAKMRKDGLILYDSLYIELL